MEPASVGKLASVDDRREYRRWVRRIAVVYGLLLAGGVTYAVIHQHASGGSAAIAATAGAAVVADYHGKR